MLYLCLYHQQFNFFIMAVQPEIIKARLKALFPKANLSTKRIDAYAAKLAPKPADDADAIAIDAIINDYNEVIDFVAVAQEDDRIRTLEADKKKAEELANKGGKKEEEEVIIEVDNDAPAWAKALIRQNEKLTADLESLKTGKIADVKKQTAQSAFESSEVLKGLKPEIKTNWLGRINVDSEVSIEDQVKALEAEFSDIRQSVAETTRYAGVVPSFTSKDGTPDEKEVTNIVDGLI